MHLEECLQKKRAVEGMESRIAGLFYGSGRFWALYMTRKIGCVCFFVSLCLCVCVCVCVRACVCVCIHDFMLVIVFAFCAHIASK
jgi:hypothetical protein